MLDNVPSCNPVQYQETTNDANLRKRRKTCFQAQFFSGVFYLYQQLYIAPSYHPMQFNGKLKNKTCENGEKPIFRPYFGLFRTNLGPKNIFPEFYLYQMLKIVASYHQIQFQGKRVIQTQENGKKKLILDLIQDLWTQIRAVKFFL